MQIAVILAAEYKDGRALGREPAQYSPAKEQRLPQSLMPQWSMP